MTLQPVSWLPNPQVSMTKQSKVDGLKKLPTRACLFNDFLHFKGCPYINHKISRDLSLTMTIFLTFHNRFMMLVHMEVHSKK